jgi:DNA-directed RNA polymerase subunit RPC12/RpoP
MRLIDADALIQKRSHAKNYSPDMYVIGQGYVMDAETVEVAPVVRGEWTYSRTQSEFAVSKCSNCGKEQFSISHVVTEGNYCPNCGAKMGDKP